jgi:hypothetical protein
VVYGESSLPSLQKDLGIIHIHIKGSDLDTQGSLVDAIRKVLSPPPYIELPDPEYYERLKKVTV